MWASFPIFVDEHKLGISRDMLYEKMKQKNIYGRRYFYPLISTFSTYRGLESAAETNLPVAVKLSNTVICLPIYADLSDTEVDAVIDSIMCNINK